MVQEHPRYLQLAQEWSSSNRKKLAEYSKGSGYKAVWDCQQGHTWEASIVKRYKGSNCPFCSNRRILEGYNDLATVCPDLVEEWHPTLNLPILPSGISRGSSLKVWWQCAEGHEWQALVYERSSKKRGTNCPYCSNRKVLVGKTDLSTSHPELFKEWGPKNTKRFQDLSAGSGYLAHWVCSNSHSYQARIYSRTKKIKPTGCPYCSGNRAIPEKTSLTALSPLLIGQWHPTRNLPLTPEQVSHKASRKVWWQCDKGHEWEACPNDRHNTSTSKGYTECPYCTKSSSISSSEQELGAYILSLGLHIETNTRDVISPLELDIYVPALNIAVEYNGLYWHTEEKRGRSYHYDKWKACKDQGVQLIQIWEDDWLSKPAIVKQMLSSKLGQTDSTKVYARSCSEEQVSSENSKTFFENNHIQGYTNGKTFGLHYQGVLKAAMIVKTETTKNGKALNIIRYATSQSVPGGFSRLLNHVLGAYPEVQEVISFSDNTVSDGGLYSSNGFDIEHELKPDYMYVYRQKRLHKFGYRLKRFRNDPELKYEEGLTERQLAELNGLERIWDAGKVKWVMKVNSEFAGEDVVDSGEEPLEG